VVFKNRCKSTWFWRQKKSNVRRYSYITGGTVISEERGYTLENTTLEMLGTAKK
jgi:chaperonin GroEL